MARTLYARALVVLTAIPAVVAAQSVPSPAPSDSVIRGWLVPRVENGHLASAVVGVLENGKERYVSYGRSNFGTTPLVDPDAIYEIGSISKVFTNILLADMVLKGEMSLDDPVQKYLPATVKVPSRNGKEITLLDLATASSGLPRMPGNFKPKDPGNPFADYTVQQMYDFLSSYTLPRDPGSLYEYSNLGMGLLGHVMGLKAGKSYEALLIERVLNPLGMQDTRITLTPSMQKRFVTGHDGDMEAVPAWDIPSLAGAGALRSSARDMLKFARAVADARDGKGKLAKAIAMSMEPRRPTTIPNMRIGLAWHVRNADGRRTTWHNGGTGGFRTWFGIDSASNVAAVVLTNGGDSSDELGFHLLNPSFPLRTIVPRPVVAVAESTLQQYVGHYNVAPTFQVDVTREGDKLYAKPTGQPRMRLWPSSEREFALRAAPVKVAFEADSSGAITIVIDQGTGAKMRAKKE